MQLPLPKLSPEPYSVNELFRKKKGQSGSEAVVKTFTRYIAYALYVVAAEALSASAAVVKRDLVNILLWDCCWGWVGIKVIAVEGCKSTRTRRGSCCYL